MAGNIGKPLSGHNMFKKFNLILFNCNVSYRIAHTTFVPFLVLLLSDRHRQNNIYRVIHIRQILCVSVLLCAPNIVSHYNHTLQLCIYIYVDTHVIELNCVHILVDSGIKYNNNIVFYFIFWVFLRMTCNLVIKRTKPQSLNQREFGQRGISHLYDSV